MKICIDAGHGGTDPGAVADGIPEKNLNLDIAIRLYKALEDNDHQPYMTRWTDRSLSLMSRVRYANRVMADRFVSIHCNAAANDKAVGMEVFHFPGSHMGNRIASDIMVEFELVFPHHNMRGVKSANFTVIRETIMPAVLVECEFLTNPKQRAFLSEPANQWNIATAVMNGL